MTALRAPTARDTGHLALRGAPRTTTQGPISVLFSGHVKVGREHDYQTWAHGITATAKRFPGHLSASALNGPGSREYHMLYSFAAPVSTPGSTRASTPGGWLRSAS